MNPPKITPDQMITGDNLRLCCDVDSEHNADYRGAVDKHPDRSLTVFCQTHSLAKVVPFLASRKDKRFTVVSHNSDGTVGRSPGREFDYHWQPVENIIYWFCQNLDVREDFMFPLPIGMENDYVPHVKAKRQLMAQMMVRDFTKQDRLFVCFNRQTNAERPELYKKYGDSSWATCREGTNSPNYFQGYFRQIVSHGFVLSPEGNGLDTIRTWEALYLGCIPVVKRRVFTEWFANHLPIIVVDSWEEATLPNLIKRKQEMNGRNFDWKTLGMDYWKETILAAKKSVQGEHKRIVVEI